MLERDMQKLINIKKYQVFIIYCPCKIHLCFASHPWFVCNNRGEITRWEMLFEINVDEDWGHLHLNHYLPFKGREVFPFFSKFKWRSKLLIQVEGSLAKRMIDFIKTTKIKYPCKEYSLIGANSNTYVQWVIDAFPELNCKLPWNSFGKNFNKSIN